MSRHTINKVWGHITETINNQEQDNMSKELEKKTTSEREGDKKNISGNCFIQNQTKMVPRW